MCHGDLNILKLSLHQYSRSRAAHRVVKGTQFTFVVCEMSKACVETRSELGKDKMHQEIDLFHGAQEKTAMDNLKFARTHDFLAVSTQRANEKGKKPFQSQRNHARNRLETFSVQG